MHSVWCMSRVCKGVELVVLDVGPEAEAPLPTEFRIFKMGKNESTKGPALFDEASARMVMDAYARNGVDLMVDLAHDSLNEEAHAQRDDADDARGWFQLEVREDGLYAVNVTWTEDGERRLRTKRQRYISPAFYRDRKTGRVKEMVNVALCSRPATYGAEPLIAATKGTMRIVDRIQVLCDNHMDDVALRELTTLSMSPDMAKKALAVIKEGSGEAALAMVEALLAEAVGGGAPAEEAPPTEETASPDEPPSEKPEDEPAQNRAEVSATELFLCSALGASDVADAKRKLSSLVATTNRLAAERVVAEASERMDLVGRLVACRGETPATAWENAEVAALDPAKGVLVARLRNEDLASMRARTEALEAASDLTVTYTAGGVGGVPVGVDAATWTKMTPEQRASFSNLTQGWK